MAFHSTFDTIFIAVDERQKKHPSFSFWTAISILKNPTAISRFLTFCRNDFYDTIYYFWQYFNHSLYA